MKHLSLLTSKPMLYVANVAEDEVASPEDNEYVQKSKNTQVTKVHKLSLFQQKSKKN